MQVISMHQPLESQIEVELLCRFYPDRTAPVMSRPRWKPEAEIAAVQAEQAQMAQMAQEQLAQARAAHVQQGQQAQQAQMAQMAQAQMVMEAQMAAPQAQTVEATGEAGPCQWLCLWFWLLFCFRRTCEIIRLPLSHVCHCLSG